ncbi:MAG: hypothetical protein ACI81O_002565, partial [Cyclobacteriaceae bacterium]
LISRGRGQKWRYWHNGAIPEVSTNIVWEAGKIKIKHVQSKGLWLMTRGSRLLYCGRLNPWQSPGVIAKVLRREGKRFRYLA